MLNLYRDVFACLSSRRARYVVIGGIAAIVHGVPRATFDLDLLIEPTVPNARRVLDAFLDAGLATASLTTPESLASTEITIFKDRLRIDVQTRTPGIEFATAWARRVTMRHRGQRFHVASREDLIASKRAAARPVDLEDIRLLQLSRPEEAT
jgi:hypothetical protein